MSEKSTIEWTEATWNPVLGCTHVSEGCEHCYAARETSGRLSKHPLYAGLAKDGKFTGEMRLVPERLEDPLHWRRPRMVFVNSMSDLFEDQVTDGFIGHVFAIMATATQHTFQVLTKRPGRMASLVPRLPDIIEREVGPAIPESHMPPALLIEDGMWPLPNVWLGTSVETQKWADVRIPKLLETPAAVRFLSCEPLLGPINLGAFLGAGTGTGTGSEGGPSTTAPTAPAPGDGQQDRRSNGGRRAPSSSLAGGGNAVDPGSARAWPGSSIDWVIVGGESGPGARPMHPDWARSLRDQCVAAGVPFFFKQHGEYTEPRGPGVYPTDVNVSDDGEFFVAGSDYVCFPNESEGVHLRRYGKKRAGRELDGQTWDEMPERAS